MKENIKRNIGFVLIIVGLFTIGIIIYKKIDTFNRQKQLKNILEEVINNEVEDENSELTNGEEEESNEVINRKEEVLINGYKPIALMEIPSIDLSQGVVEGVTDDILQYYLGKFETSVNPGEKGNFIVAGHRVSDYSEAFVNLYKANVGEEILVKSNKKEYVYVITDIFTVSPNSIEVLENTKDATITLITCTVGAKERLIVKGRLIESKNI